MSALTYTCPKCNRTLPLSSFSKNNSVKCKHQSYCKDCMCGIIKDKYRNDPKTRAAILNHAKKDYEKTKTDPILKQHRRDIANKALRKYRKINRKKYYAFEKTKVLFKATPELLKELWQRADNCCEHCKIPLIPNKWAVHHLNRNRYDNSLENLKLLCTACHLHVYHKGEQNKKHKI